MHVVLATVGTDGDVFPHLGLGAVLRGRGHRVTLTAPEPYRAGAEARGLGFEPLVTADETARMLADPDMWHPLRSGRMMARWGAPLIPRQYEVLARLVGEEPAVLVANPGLLAARVVQERLGVPTASLLLQPGLIPSVTAPPEMTGGLTPPHWLPRPLVRLYWRGVDAAGAVLVGRDLNRFRRQFGLAPVRRVFRWWLSPQLVIGLFPPWYAAPQPDWPPQLQLAGFGRFDGADDPLSVDVEAFLRAGPPPVAFTLGTGMAHAAAFFRTAVAACEALGVRGLLLTKFGHLLPRLPALVRHCRFAPFRRLLPRCAAVVHHGGVGTTAAALETGCPQVVVPLAWDQPDNAARVEALGVGTTLGRRQRTRGALAAALARVTTPGACDRARVAAAKARGADGLAVAAGWVEELARGSGVS
ncbi:glycosyltransferase family 1 protein [bacterium]|nr:glycosyltransferase family 1 protein [bacterium]